MRVSAIGGQFFSVPPHFDRAPRAVGGPYECWVRGAAHPLIAAPADASSAGG
jgi:hypothetical protein